MPIILQWSAFCFYSDSFKPVKRLVNNDKAVEVKKRMSRFVTEIFRGQLFPQCQNQFVTFGSVQTSYFDPLPSQMFNLAFKAISICAVISRIADSISFLYLASFRKTVQYF